VNKCGDINNPSSKKLESARRLSYFQLAMVQEKRSLAYRPDDLQVKGIPAPVVCQGHPHQPNRLIRTLARSILLSIFFLTLTLYVWGVVKYDRSNDGEAAAWIADAFVHYGHGKHGKGGPIRGKAAEKLYLSVCFSISLIPSVLIVLLQNSSQCNKCYCSVAPICNQTTHGGYHGRL
jgi:hypothetical protein